MPYIEQYKREELEAAINVLSAKLSLTNSEAGDINYAITKILLGQLGPKPNYDDINKIMGVLECIKQEFYRRHATKFEEEKAKINGDVY